MMDDDVRFGSDRLGGGFVERSGNGEGGDYFSGCEFLDAPSVIPFKNNSTESLTASGTAFLVDLHTTRLTRSALSN